MSGLPGREIHPGRGIVGGDRVFRIHPPPLLNARHVLVRQAVLVFHGGSGALDPVADVALLDLLLELLDPLVGLLRPGRGRRLSHQFSGDHEIRVQGFQRPLEPSRASSGLEVRARNVASAASTLLARARSLVGGQILQAH